MTALKLAGTHLLQNLFFPGLKVKISNKWRENLRTNATVSEVEIERSGRRLSALLVMPAQTALEAQPISKVAILSHPISKKGKYYFAGSPTLETYLKNGVPVVVFDFNGFGESDRIDMYYWKDATAVAKKASELYPNAKIILHGTSFGAFHIVRAIPTLPKGSTAILENVSRSLYDYWKRWFLTRNAVSIIQKLPLQAFRDMEIQSVLRELDYDNLNVEMIACENDRFTPAEEMKDLARTGHQKIGYHSFASAEHLKASESDPQRYNTLLEAVISREKL